MKKKQIIPIFFTIDDKFTPYVDCAIRSIMANASPNYQYDIHVLYEGIPEARIQQIKKSVQEPFHIYFTEMKEQYDGLYDREENRLRCDYFTMTIYFRIFIAEMFPQYDKGIYIDSDVVVPGDISELYNIDLDGKILAACPDHSVSMVPELADYMDYAIGVGHDYYINSGILLMDLRKMRKVKFADHFLYLLNKYHFDCVAPDQDYINAMCKGNILFLDECWDAMPPTDPTFPTLENPKLIHYNLFQKPWMYDRIPYEEYFWIYAKQSPFYQEILDFKANYTDDQKEADEKCLAYLIYKGGAMAQRDITFKKIAESGEKIEVQ